MRAWCACNAMRECLALLFAMGVFWMAPGPHVAPRHLVGLAAALLQHRVSSRHLFVGTVVFATGQRSHCAPRARQCTA